MTRRISLWTTSVALTFGSCAGHSRTETSEATLDAQETSASIPAPPSTNDASFTWPDHIWFGRTNDPSRFITTELSGLLGTPSRDVRPVGRLREVGPGEYEFINGIGDRVPTLVLLPSGRMARGDPATWDIGLGLVVALHQTNLEGPSEPCNTAGEARGAYGTAFAIAGYLTVCPNLAFTGSRQPELQWDTAAFYDENPRWSAMGRDITEVRWLLDSLSASDVDTSLVTLVGHSQGAIYSIYAGAIDGRVDLVIANAGFVDTERDPEPLRWSRESWYRAFREYPVGLDFLEVIAAIAPRCTLVISYSNDDILVATLPDDTRFNAFTSRFPSIEWWKQTGPHDWPSGVVADAIEWTHEHLGSCQT
jgi:hypothetical protein